MRNLLILFILFIATPLITACKAKVPFIPEPAPVATPLPYKFHVSSIVDSRAVKAPSENLNVYPFNRNTIVSAVHTHLPTSLFATYPARLNIEVLEYATTGFNNSFALSYAVQMYAYDEYNRVIAPKQVYTCSETFDRAFYAHKLAESAYKGESLSNAAQTVNIFEDLTNTCVKRTMTSFYNNVIGTAN